MMNFYVAKNLTEMALEEGKPWEFIVENNPFKGMAKDKRRLALLKPKTEWNVYTAVRGMAATQRISKTNPPVALRGIVVDYDMQSNIDVVMGYVNQLPESVRPNFIEVTLGGKIRLVWVFEREVLTPSTEFCIELLTTFHDTLGIPTLLAGYDPASLKPTEMWTNGGTWYDVRPEPLKYDYCFGVVCEVAKKSSLFERGEIPMETIATEVAKRWPGKWQGDFKQDALGVRFWDEKADNPTGCQVKPDGMLCFTGNQPFVKWEELFGRPWCEEQKVLNLGRAADNIHFDGKTYWELNSGKWESSSREDIRLRLKGRGLSDRTPKGATQSDVERVLDHIQQNSRVTGAAPLVNYPPGIVDLQGRRLLNIADLSPIKPIAGTGDPEKDFPWLWKFLNGLFPRPELRPLDFFLAWLQRSYKGILNHKRYMGQAMFLCGPRNNGKTLLCLRVVAPLLGNRVSNPIAYMTGESDFNSDLFASALLAVNDEDSPNGETARKRMLAKLKGLVVNPSHKYHAKFEKPVTIDWTGRIFVTLNDDPGSIGMLMEVEKNTHDKQSFFASQPYSGVFPEQEELEALLTRELPYFAHWLLNIYKAPQEVLSTDRMGVKSYFDPVILELSQQQTFSSNLEELLRVWENADAYWGEENGFQKSWTGSPTELLVNLQTCVDTAGIAKGWTQQGVAKSLVSLAKQENSRVTFTGESGREFTINKYEAPETPSPDETSNH